MTSGSSDHPALIEAVQAARGGGDVVAAFCVDDRLWGPSGDNRRAFLVGLPPRARRRRSAGTWWCATAIPCVVLPALAAEVGAAEVFVTADFAPYGAPA